MKKQVIFFCALVCAVTSHFTAQGQDSSAINRSWVLYAMDTSLTFQQIVTTCDSLFLVAGYPEIDTAGQPDTSMDVEGSAYSNYCGWKNFWAGRPQLG